jgi:hypothetical protein
LAAALGKPDPTKQSALVWKEEPHSDETNVPIARRLATGRLNAPTARDQLWSLIRLLQERRLDGN